MTLIVVYIVFGFVGLQFLNVLINLLFVDRIRSSSVSSDKMISILIPARNEEANIGALLEDLYLISDKPFEVVVYDDCSTDGTAQIVNHYSSKDNRFKLIRGIELPREWLGKNHACFQLATYAKGEYLLFVDADVRLKGSILKDAVSYMEKNKLGMLSLFPKQLYLSKGELASVPLMNYILLTLLPLVFVRISPFTSHSAANGQFLMFTSEIYKKFQPHLNHKQSSVEDIAIARHLKKSGVKIACTTGDERVACRMYDSYNAALHGFSKNIFMFFGNIKPLAFLFGLLASFSFLLLIFFGDWKLLMLYFSIVIFIQLFYAVRAKQNVLQTIIYYPIHLVFMWQVMVKSLLFSKRKNYSWKGRNVA